MVKNTHLATLGKAAGNKVIAQHPHGGNGKLHYGLVVGGDIGYVFVGNDDKCVQYSRRHTQKHTPELRN